jgi:hypothetical protein
LFDDSPSRPTDCCACPVVCAATPATCAASLALVVISRMAAPISSAPAATVETLPETRSASMDTTPAWFAVSLADVDSSLATPDSSDAVPASRCELSTTCRTIVPIDAAVAFSVVPRSPSSSRLVTVVRAVRSPALIALRATTHRSIAAAMSRPRPRASAIPTSRVTASSEYTMTRVEL